MVANHKPIINIRYPCYVCGDSFKMAAGVIMHIQKRHGHLLPSRLPSVRRPFNKEYNYQNDVSMDWDEEHHGCPSCWFHSKDYEEFQEHVEQEHGPNKGKQPKTQQQNGKKRVPAVAKKNVQFDTDDEEEEGDNRHYDPTLGQSLSNQINDLSALVKKMLKM